MAEDSKQSLPIKDKIVSKQSYGDKMKRKLTARKANTKLKR
jgi:hypothetical protein